ncbi:MAG: heme exporter protein CcmD [Anaerolineae bacterium]|nr:heme exporter protein CcmD [Anaerolineae bacterium]
MNLLEDKNAVYLFTAYGLFLGGLAIYLASLWLRSRSLDRDEEILRQIEEEERRSSKASSRTSDSRDGGASV